MYRSIVATTVLLVLSILCFSHEHVEAFTLFVANGKNALGRRTMMDDTFAANRNVKNSKISFAWCCRCSLSDNNDNGSDNDSNGNKISNGDGDSILPHSHLYTLKQRNPYDVHVYYDHDDPSSRDEAMALRQRMMERFPFMRFYNPRGYPIGPHPVPMWEADFGSYDHRDRWLEVRDFITKGHGNLSVLIHPHSTDGDYADHTKNAWWAGEVLELRIQGWNR